MRLIQLLLVAWLPGTVIFRLPFADRKRRAALDAEERVFWAVIISLAVSLSVVLALALVNRYTFERLLLVNAVCALVAAAAGRFRLGLGPGAPRVGTTAVLPLVLVLLGLWRFFPPSEYVIGGKDPGTYMNEGIQIAQRGALLIRDPVVSSVPPFARDLFFPSHHQADYYSLRFMGFRIQDPEAGTVVGQFPHLFPASIAIAYGLDGLTGARRAVGVWAILGLVAVYFASARLIGRSAAFLAASLLAFNIIQTWFARYPNAELVMQALVFAALLANARAHVDDDPFFAPIAGVLFGLLLFLRFDAVLALAGVSAALALMVLVGGRIRWSFVATLTLTVALAVSYLLGPMRAYAVQPRIFFQNLQTWHWALLWAATLSGAAALTIGRRFPVLSDWVRRAVPGLLTVAVVGATIYALYFRHPGLRLADHDAYALRTFTSFYLTLPALIAALVGFALLARRAFWRAPDLFLTVAAFSFFFFYKVRIVPDHFWMTRRFLPVILPGVLLFAAAAAFSGARGGNVVARAIRGGIGLVFLVLLGISYGRASRPILNHVEYAGVIPKLEQLARTIHDNDLLIVEARSDSDIHVLALPLAYIYARNVLVFPSLRPDKAVFAEFLAGARTQYGRVLFMGGGGTALLSPAWGTQAIASDRFQIPEYAAPWNDYPRSVRQKEFDYSIYALTPPDVEEAPQSFDLDVGVRDDLHVLRFHAKEQTEGRTFRWSRDVSYVTVTNLRATSREVTLWLSDGGRPPAAQPADVAVFLDNEPLGTLRVNTGFKPYTLAIAPQLAQRIAAREGMAELKLVVTTWKPELVLGTADPRDLGVMVDRVAVQ